MTFIETLIEDYPAEYFVETGTSGGGTVVNAEVSSAYKEIRTVELDKELIPYHKSLGLKEVKFYYGDSRKKLWEMIEDLEGKIFFWLDAHTSPNVQLREKYGNIPIMEELDIIEKHPIKDHVIVIDDVSVFGEPVFDNITLKELEEKILKINKKYKFKYIDNVLIATI